MSGARRFASDAKPLIKAGWRSSGAMGASASWKSRNAAASRRSASAPPSRATAVVFGRRYAPRSGPSAATARHGAASGTRTCVETSCRTRRSPSSMSFAAPDRRRRAPRAATRPRATKRIFGPGSGTRARVPTYVQRAPSASSVIATFMSFVNSMRARVALCRARVASRSRSRLVSDRQALPLRKGLLSSRCSRRGCPSLATRIDAFTALQPLSYLRIVHCTARRRGKLEFGQCIWL